MVVIILNCDYFKVIKVKVCVPIKKKKKCEIMAFQVG